jgi:lipoprotein-anchoring transpeptidase ErfK/SrfK
MRIAPSGLSKFFAASLAILAIHGSAMAGSPFFGAKPEMKKAGDLIHRQAPPNVTARVYNQLTPDQSRVVVSISKQRAYLLLGEEIAIDTPISSGKAGRPTPQGSYRILEKDADHRSNIYGAFCDSQRRIVREGVSSVIDSAPSGTHFIGAPMKWFMRLTDKGVGMHTGILPGYPASHGCIRLPDAIAKMIYEKVKIGTPVKVEP